MTDEENGAGAIRMGTRPDASMNGRSAVQSVVCALLVGSLLCLPCFAEWPACTESPAEVPTAIPLAGSV